LINSKSSRISTPKNSDGANTQGKDSLASTSTLNLPYDQDASTDQKKPPVSRAGAESLLLPQSQRPSNNHGSQSLQANLHFGPSAGHTQ
jgi:hypothetical protein